MVQPTNFTPKELDQLQQLRTWVLDFREMVNMLPAEISSAEHNQQFNQLYTDVKPLLKDQAMVIVPKAITGDLNTDRSLSIVVVLGVIMALIGIGINAVILDDVFVNSLGCCISSGGMLFVIGAFGVLTMKHYRQRTSNMADLRQRCDLLLYQIDYHLQKVGIEIG